MAHTHLAFILFILAVFKDCEANKREVNLKPTLDPKRRNNIIDETFLEQKDILLDMLESKLKEVKDKKKKKGDQFVGNNLHLDQRNMEGHGLDLCSRVMQNVDVKTKINGIGAVGEADIKLNYGNSGNSVVKLNANGISNIGQSNVELGVGNSGIYIPGLSNLFIDNKMVDCLKRGASGNNGDVLQNDLAPDSRKSVENNETNSKTTKSSNDITDTAQVVVRNNPEMTDATLSPAPNNPPSPEITQGPRINTFTGPVPTNPAQINQQNDGQVAQSNPPNGIVPGV